MDLAHYRKPYPGTLVMQRSGEQPGILHWEIHMQGPQETVFLEF